MENHVTSTVIPLYNEEENINPLFERFQKTLLDLGKTFEIIFVKKMTDDFFMQHQEDIYIRQQNVKNILMS